MQIKKEDIGQKIVEVATEEFIKRGYEKASLRTIARKSNTTLGNIYRYFSSKEDLLEVILLPVIENIEKAVRTHRENHPSSRAEAENMLKNLNLNKGDEALDFFFDKRVLILIEIKTTKFSKIRDTIVEDLQTHLEEHLKISTDFHYSKILVETFINCLKHVLLEYDEMEKAKEEFIKLFTVFCIGTLGQI